MMACKELHISQIAFENIGEKTAVIAGIFHFRRDIILNSVAKSS